MFIFTVSYQFPFPCAHRTCHTPVRRLVHTLCAILRGGGPAVGNVAILQRTICHPFTMLPPPVVRCTYANLQCRLSTFLAFLTLPWLQRATVATHFRRASPSISGPSATKRALGWSWWGSLWCRHQHQEEEGEQDGEGTCLELAESSASAVR